MTRLIQFECQREGSLFYYQHVLQSARYLVQCCPICGTTQVSPTGREYAPVNETSRIPKGDG